MRRIHPAWAVAVVTAGALLSAAAFRSTTGVLMEPIMATTGWPMSTLSGAASLNLILYGIATPFTAAIMQVWGVRRTVVLSLVLVGAASAATCAMTAQWQIWALWGVCIGIGTGALALTFGTIIANRWFVTHRNLVTGIFSAATAAGQVLFVPLIAKIAEGPGWKTAALVTTSCAALTAIACFFWLRDRPSDRGVLPYGADVGAGDGPVGNGVSDGAATPAIGPDGEALAAQTALTEQPERAEYDEQAEAPLRSTFRVLARGARLWPFWVLMATFFVCGWSTNGIVVTHFVPAAHDHSMPQTMAASLIGVIGIFDVVGTIASGWLTDRYDPRILLAVYYLTRGVSLVFVNGMLGPHMGVPLWAWIVFYGLDWTATVPPTVDLCREIFGIADSGVAFGWVYASHMVGAGIGASVSGMLRSGEGTYSLAWIITAVLCGLAGVLALTIRLRRPVDPVPPVVSW